MTQEQRAREVTHEWRGPWKCEKCGLDYPNATSNLTAGKCQIHCGGTLKPYDRRRAAPGVVEARARIESLEGCLRKLRDSLQAFHSQSKRVRECPTCQLLADADALLAPAPGAEEEKR